MTITQQMANVFRASYLGPNFPGVLFKDALTTITW